MFKLFRSCCCMREKRVKKKKKKDDKKSVPTQGEDQLTILSCKSPTSEGASYKASRSKAQTPNAPSLKTSCSTSEIIFTSNSPIFTLHRTTLPAVSTSSEDFCFYQVIHRWLNVYSVRQLPECKQWLTYLK